MPTQPEADESAAPARSRLPLAAGVVVALVALGVALRMNFEPHEVVGWLAARRAIVNENLVVAVAAYAAFYVAYAALCLPLIWIVSVAGGLLFGPWIGFPLVAVSSAAGATAAMLASRYLLRDAVAAMFPGFVEKTNRGIARDGARWVFASRLIPVVPFFAVNLAVGLTQMPALVFAAASFLGALPLALLFVISGAQFATIERPSDVLSLPVVAALIALAAAPFAPKLLRGRRARESQ